MKSLLRLLDSIADSALIVAAAAAPGAAATYPRLLHHHERPETEKCDRTDERGDR